MDERPANHDPPPPFCGLILAGGLGTRWGGPKAWVLLPDGRTFLEACVTLLEQAGALQVAATLPTASMPPVKVHCRRLHLPEQDLDMFASLRWGLKSLLHDSSWQAVVVLPVDHPLVSPLTVQALVRSGPPAALPTLDGRHGHPLTLWRDVAEQVSTGGLPGPTLREVLSAVDARDVAVDDAGVRANCNTPEALAAALRL